jgi:hypothetical protein
LLQETNNIVLAIWNMNPPQDDESKRSSHLLSSIREDTPDKVDIDTKQGGKKSSDKTADNDDISDSSSDKGFGTNEEKLDSKPSPSVLGTAPDQRFSSNTGSCIVEIPTDQDVLFGRGRPFQSHPGNVHLHKLVALHKDRYENSRRFDKLAIADQIVYEIKRGSGNRPGRFLRRVDGEDYWEEVPDGVSREKVAHALRGHIKQAREHLKRDNAAKLRTVDSNIKTDISQSNVDALQTSSLFPSNTSQGAVAVTQPQFNASSSISGIASMSSLMSQQQHSNLDALRRALATDVQSTSLAAMLAAQQEQHQQLRYSADLAVNDLLQYRARNPQPSLSLDSLANILSAQQLQRQQQERLVAFQLLEHSNEMNPLAQVLATNSNSITALEMSRALSRNRLSVDNALAVLQQSQAESSNSLLNSLSSVSGNLDIMARHIQSAQISAAIARALSGQQQQSPSRNDETKDTNEDPSSRGLH